MSLAVKDPVSKKVKSILSILINELHGVLEKNLTAVKFF